jgi:hypothetical protein
VTDPTVGAILLSQFATTTSFGSSISIQSISVAVVPEPSTLALGGIGLLAVGWAVRRGQGSIPPSQEGRGNGLLG